MSLFTVDLTNSIFLVCALAGGILLLVTVLVDDILGGALDAIGVPVDLGGLSLMPILLAFVSLFGVGGLMGVHLFKLDNGPASLLGAALGVAGSFAVGTLFKVLQRSESPGAFSIRDLINQPARVTVSIPANRHGTVVVNVAGTSQQYGATANMDIAAGTSVKVIDVGGSTLVVEPTTTSDSTTRSVQ